MDEEEGPGWTLERCDEAEVWYKRFLFLCYKYPDSGFCPVGDIDDFWHQHILDTRKYHQDCDDLFGYFLHHFPYLGMRSEADAEKLKEVASSTFDILQSEFGESLGSTKASHCEHKCLIGKCARPKCNNCSKCTRSAGEDTRPELNRPKKYVEWRPS